MAEKKRDKRKVAPSGAEENQPAEPLKTVPPGQPANATTAEIPGTGEVHFPARHITRVSVRTYIRPFATAQVACVPSPRGMRATSTYFLLAARTCMLPSRDGQ